jgi:hypothetical protein
MVYDRPKGIGIPKNRSVFPLARSVFPLARSAIFIKLARSDCFGISPML